MPAMLKSPLEKVERILKTRGNAGKICSSPLQTATVELMGVVDTYWPDAHFDANKMAKLSTAAYEIAGIEGLRVPFDIGIEAEAFGCEVKIGRADIPPSIMNPAFAEFEELHIPRSIQEKGRIPTLLRAIRVLKEKYGDILPIYPMIIGPISLLGFLVGIEKTLYTLSTEPDALKGALDQVTQFNIDLANTTVEEGNGFLCIADPVASGDLVAAEHFAEHILPHYQRIRQRVHGLIILHICGNTNPLLPQLPDTGFEAFSFQGPEVEVKDAKKVLGGKMALVGNLPNETLLRFRSPRAVMNGSIKALEDGVDILAPACGFHPLTPLQNMKAMVRAVEKFA